LRRVRFNVPLDTSLFTPLQLQPRFLFWLGMNGWSRWVREHLVSFRRLIREHNLGVVVVSVGLEYLRPFGFFDAAELVVEIGWRARMGGVVLEGEIDYIGGNERVAKGGCTLRPVRLQDQQSLAAVPSRLSRALLDQFQSDEIDRERPRRVLPAVIESIERGECIAEAACPLTIHRHDCEVADQWSFIDLPSHAGAARERLVLERAGSVPFLGSALANPVRSIHVELSRAMFLLDEATTHTKAYRSNGELGLVHRLGTGTQEHAVVAERIAPFD
jgi:acyl-CoA thioesterase FadM